jgi:hypothetical protein
LRFSHPRGELSLFTTIATFGTPAEVTVSELAMESFFPADSETAARLQQGTPRQNPRNPKWLPGKGCDAAAVAVYDLLVGSVMQEEHLTSWATCCSR